MAVKSPWESVYAARMGEGEYVFSKAIETRQFGGSPAAYRPLLGERISTGGGLID